MKKKIKKYLVKILKKFKIYNKLKKDYTIKALFSKSFKETLYYTHYYEKKSILNNYIFYESNSGSNFNSNPYALFLYLSNNKQYINMKHVISIKDLNNKQVSELSKLNNVIIVKPKSKEYIKYLESCKYVIIDGIVNPCYIKQDDQICINTFDKVYKPIGRDTNKIWENKNMSKTILNMDYIISPNKLATDVTLKAFCANTLYNGSIIETSLPKYDLYSYYNKDEIKTSLNLDLKKKVVLYAPTARTNNDVILEEYNKIKASLKDKYQVILKLEQKITNNSIDIVPNDIDNIKLLSIVDILITDYSNIMFDFALTNKPFILYQFDHDEYLKQFGNGLYINNKEIPGPILNTYEQVISYIKDINKESKNYTQKYNNFIKKYIGIYNNNASKIVVDTIFKGNIKTNKLKSNKERILIYQNDFKGNGVTETLLTLFDAIDYNKYDVTLLSKGYDKFFEKQLRINPNVNVIYMSKTTLYKSKKEYNVLNRFLKDGYKKDIKTLRNISERNVKVLFPNIKFDHLIEYNGYVPINALILSLGVQAKNKAIYMHNNLYQDMLTKNFQLHSVFSTYEFFDKLVSVSENCYKANLREASKYIKEKYNLDVASKMTYIINLINYKKVLDDANVNSIIKKDKIEYIKVFGRDEESSRYIEAPNKKDTNFITIGRLSPEKNHLNLIEAFESYNKLYPNSKLYIIGEGVLKEDTEKCIIDKKLEDKVIMVGYTTNPFELVNHCDCFILPSLYEGMPTVILEAFILGKAVIASNIDGSRNLIEDEYGVLIETSVKAIKEAMIEYTKNGMGIKKFNYLEHNQKSIELFYENVLNK